MDKTDQSLLNAYNRLKKDNPSFELRFFKARKHCHLTILEGLREAIDKWSKSMLDIYENPTLDTLYEQSVKEMRERAEKIENTTVKHNVRYRAYEIEQEEGWLEDPEMSFKGYCIKMGWWDVENDKENDKDSV